VLSCNKTAPENVPEKNPNRVTLEPHQKPISRSRIFTTTCSENILKLSLIFRAREAFFKNNFSLDFEQRTREQRTSQKKSQPQKGPLAGKYTYKFNFKKGNA
jgi:hypothetical protein